MALAGVDRETSNQTPKDRRAMRGLFWCVLTVRSSRMKKGRNTL